MMELDKDKEFTFAAIAAMSMVSLVSGDQNENEVEELYIQIHQSDIISLETEFALETLEELNSRLQINFDDTCDSLLLDLSNFGIEHDSAVDIVNMALDVAKSNPKVCPEKIDMIGQICRSLDLYSGDFEFSQ